MNIYNFYNLTDTTGNVNLYEVCRAIEEICIAISKLEDKLEKHEKDIFTHNGLSIF